MAEPIKDASSSQTRKHLPLLAALSVLAALAISIFAFSGGEGAHAESQAAAQAGTKNADAKPTKVTSFNDQQTGDIETIVRQYLLKNPELFLDVQRELEKRLQAQETARRQTAISSNAATLFRRKDAPIAGNPDGDVTVVEFFDYNCGFCKRGLKDVEALIKADPKVKVVLKEFPIFGRASEDAARVALAAKVQGKYWEAHRALLNVEGRVDKDTALAAVKSLGLDLKKLETD
ncbi:MAG: DsbA family protein, partial [Pseudomonadota bacterium]